MGLQCWPVNSGFARRWVVDSVDGRGNGPYGRAGAVAKACLVYSWDVEYLGLYWRYDTDKSF